MKKLSKIQEEHLDWSLHNFGEAPIWMSLVGLTEELGELSHAYLKHIQGIRNNENHVEKMQDAIGDIVIYLIDFCNKCGFDLSHIIERTWSEVKKRDWRKYPENGLTK